MKKINKWKNIVLKYKHFGTFFIIADFIFVTEMLKWQALQKNLILTKRKI